MGITINITEGIRDYEFYNVPEKVAKAIITLLHECEKDDSTIVSAISEMNSKDRKWEINKKDSDKLKHIKQIYENYKDGGFQFVGMQQIGEVLDNGNDD